MDSNEPSQVPEPAVASSPIAAASPGLVRRLAPVALVAVLGGGAVTVFQRDVIVRDELAATRAARDDAEQRVGQAAADLRAGRDELARAAKERERLEGELESARRGSSDELERVRAEKANLEKKVADLADRLGEAEAGRAAAEKHARELDEVMDALRHRRINARRLAGLESPPRLDTEVVSEDDGRVPPVLVLRARAGLAGLEEGDVLYLVRASDGREREVGRAAVERVDSERRLLQARVVHLDAGERISVGDRFTTYPPGS
jgi:chromosome segregation ATPase